MFLFSVIFSANPVVGLSFSSSTTGRIRLSTLTISRVIGKPKTFASNTLYLVESPSGFLDIYVAGNDPTQPLHVATQAESVASAVVFSATAPDLTVPQKLWFDSVNGTLYIKYDDGTTVNWVEAMPTIAVPEFAGTGQASTMARSDHDHDSVYIKAGVNEW